MKETEKQKKKERLTRDRVVDEALEIVRTRGISSLTMAGLAKALNVTTMAAYRHVSGRDDIIAALINRTSDTIVHPPLEADPVDDVEAVFLAFYDVLRDNSWIIPFLVDNHDVSDHALELILRTLRGLEAMGLERRMIWHSYKVLEHYTFGEVLAIAEKDVDSFQLPITSKKLRPSEEQIKAYIEDAEVSRFRDLYQRSLRRLLLSIESDAHGLNVR